MLNELLISTVAGFGAFALVFAMTLYGLIKRNHSKPDNTKQPEKPASTQTVEDKRIDLTREARHELTQPPPAPAPVATDDLPSVVIDLHERANRKRAGTDED